MLHDSLVAAIRTGVASVVGLFVAFLVSKGFSLDSNFGPTLITALTVLFTAGYNYLVIILEKKVNPLFGVLLGVPKSPSYTNSAGSDGTPTDEDLANLESSH